jgi:hypothetical protein
MPRTLQFKRYSSATLANTTGANGELIIDTTNQTLTIHDGVTPGGRSLATSNTKLSTTGGTVTGNLVVTNTITASNLISSNTITSTNLTVTGNLIVDGVVLQWHTPIPLTSKGDPGDKAGLIAIDNDKLYRCVENYTNGANNIWRYINFTGGTWG